MMLTKDNLLRFVREKKFVTPTHVSEVFETSTMIASAALSELAKDRHIGITHLKLGNSPYYYDLKNKECLVEIGEKHLGNYDKEVFERLRKEQVLNSKSLTIQQGLAVERIRDFANKISIEHDGLEYVFWVWYLRDLDDTKKQIIDALNGRNSGTKTKKENDLAKTEPENLGRGVQNQGRNDSGLQTPKKTYENERSVQSFEIKNQISDSDTKSEVFIENFFKNNYLKIESKHKAEREIRYVAVLKVNKIQVFFDCIFFLKKPTDSEILKFYTSSMKPKIIFMEQAPKKIFKLVEGLDNVEVVNI